MISARADTIRIGGVEVGSGARVRLKPSRRADAHDLFYAGRFATVKGVFNDVDGDRHVAVALDDDPATDMLKWQRRFLYFHPRRHLLQCTEGTPIMIHRLLFSLLFALVAALVVKSLPDLARYLKMREM
jgi:hypothetical protein